MFPSPNSLKDAIQGLSGKMDTGTPGETRENGCVEMGVGGGRWEVCLMAETVDKKLVMLKAGWLCFLAEKRWL